MSAFDCYEENEAFRVLDILEGIINRRITTTERIVQRHKNLLRILRDDQKKSINSSKKSVFKSTLTDTQIRMEKTATDFDESTVTAQTSDNIMPSLTKILVQAREMRSMTQRLQGQQSRSKISFDKRESQSQKGRVIKEIKEINSNPIEHKVGLERKSQKEVLRDGLSDSDIFSNSMSAAAGGVLEELKHLSRQNVTPPSCLLGTSKELFESQSIFLSKLCGRTKIPPSAPFQLVLDSLADPILYLGEFATGADETINCTLLAAMEHERKNFERALKSKLTRVSPKQLSKADIEEVISVWYRARRLIQIYEMIVTKKVGMKLDSEAQQNKSPFNPTQSSQSNTESIVLYSVDKMPLLTPMSTGGRISPSKFDHIKSTSWLTTSLQRVDDFHSNFQIRAKYVVESFIGKYNLRDVIRELKLCCEMEATSSESEESRRRRWIQALTLYRDIYCSLITEAQGFASCMFVQKE